MESSPNASILSIPRELRLQIYDHLCSAEVNYRPISQWIDSFILKSDDEPYWGFHNEPQRDSNALLSLPWLNLSLSCKTVHDEIEAYLESLSSRTRNRKPDFVVDLQPVGMGGSGLGPVTWKEIRTPLNDNGILQANIDVSRGFRLWGVGGPNSITRGLYQALNHFIHCGPQMDSERPLSKPLHLNELIINIHRGENIPQQDNVGKDSAKALFTHLNKAVQAGIFDGCIDKVTVKSGDFVLEQSIPQGESQEVPQSWDGYGFQWTLKKYQIKFSNWLG